MTMRGGGFAAAGAMLVAACVNQAEGPNRFNDAWNIDAHRAYYNVPADDPWCAYLGDLRASIDGAGPPPGKAARNGALDAIRAEADRDRGGDELWPFRKALMCEYFAGAEEEAQEFDWKTVGKFLEHARMAEANPRPTDGISTLVPVFDQYYGWEPPSLAQVDVRTDAYCRSLKNSELALTQQRGVVQNDVSFPGSLRRAPDWFAMLQVAYHRWGREQAEGWQVQEGDVDYGGIPFHCSRFHKTLEGSREFAVKQNLIFLLPELDDPKKSGRLEVTDAEGNTVVLDKILAAAQLEDDGAGGEPVDFFPEDLAASPLLAGAVKRSEDLPPPERFRILFGESEITPAEGDPSVAALRAALTARDPEEPIRIVLTGHTDCVGAASFNKRLSARRVDAVFNDVIAPTLIARGFTESDLRRRDRLKLEGVGAYAKLALGESAPLTEQTGRCEANDEERRVEVLLQ